MSSHDDMKALDGGIVALERILKLLEKVPVVGFSEANELVICSDFIHDLWKQSQSRLIELKKDFENVAAENKNAIEVAQGSH
jgi:hypothetical protein